MNSDYDYNILDNELADIELEDVELYEFGFDEFDTDDYGTDFSLKEGDRIPVQTMSLTFSDDQAEVINNAINKMKNSDTFKNYEDEYNKNTNGNALYLVVLEWLQLKK